MKKRPEERNKIIDALTTDSGNDRLVLVPSTGERKRISDLSLSEAREIEEAKIREQAGYTLTGAHVRAASLEKAETDRALASGRRISAEKRKAATSENVRAWRAKALEWWSDEYSDFALSKSSRRQIAEKIALTIRVDIRPAIGTIENAIKGVKAQARRAAKA